MKKQREEKRIYVIVPKTVQVTVQGKKKTVYMEPGRLTAQAVHVGRKLENDRCMKGIRSYEEITTIVLGVRNTREMEIIAGLFATLGIFPTCFHDTNPLFYGTRAQVLTAMCTEPLDSSVAESAIGHLELF
jgi:hypothetical protein